MSATVHFEAYDKLADVFGPLIHLPEGAPNEVGNAVVSASTELYTVPGGIRLLAITNLGPDNAHVNWGTGVTEADSEDAPIPVGVTRWINVSPQMAVFVINSAVP